MKPVAVPPSSAAGATETMSCTSSAAYELKLHMGTCAATVSTRMIRRTCTQIQPTYAHAHAHERARAHTHTPLLERLRALTCTATRPLSNLSVAPHFSFQSFSCVLYLNTPMRLPSAVLCATRVIGARVLARKSERLCVC